MDQPNERGGSQLAAADYLRRRMTEERQLAQGASSDVEAAQYLELAQAYQDRLQLLNDAMHPDCD